ncbi:high mobility group box domain-containing protein, partial [Cladochytrium replicatum]
RPSNSFMTYRKAVKPLLLEQFPYLNNKDLSVVIGQMWGQEEKHIKDHFAKLAEEAKKRHKELYPHYKFQPAK